MAPSVGRLEYIPLLPRERAWVIGAAPNMPAHWMLSHWGFDAARLVLLFRDDDSARHTLGSWMDESTRTLNGYAPIKSYVERRIVDLRVLATASVARVDGRPELFAWIHEVVENRCTELAEEFASTTHDVLLLPRRGSYPDHECDGEQFALLRNSCCDLEIRYENPRPLVW